MFSLALHIHTKAYCSFIQNKCKELKTSNRSLVINEKIQNKLEKVAWTSPVAQWHNFIALACINPRVESLET